ncbi:MAG: M12 family metallo-peptidase, partial [Planctomycetota bacterium]
MLDATAPAQGGILRHHRLLGVAAVAGAIILGGSSPPPGGVTEPPLDIAQKVRATLGLAGGVLFELETDVEPGALLAPVLLDGQWMTLELTPHSVRSANYEVLAQVPSGALVPMPPQPVRTMRGSVLEVPGSTVAASWLDDGLRALILIPGSDRYWLEPVAARVPEAAPSLHVMYQDTDIIATAGECGVSDDLVGDVAEPLGGGGAGGTACGSDPVVAELGCDADYEYFLTWGSVAAVEDRINDIINIVNVQYENEVGIVHEITTIIVRTSLPQPYTSTDSLILIDQFQDEWTTNQAGIPRDVAHLFTGKNLDGSLVGLAWGNGVVCVFFNQYCLAQSDWSGNFACVTDLSAHELGHLWGADHCNCPNFTMMGSPYGGIQCANTFHPVETIPEIISHRDKITCLECPCPENDDGLEPNDSCASAVGLPLGAIPNLVVDGASEDWYQITLPPFSNLTLDLTFTHALGDIDMELYNGCGGPIVADSTSNDNGESINYTNFGGTGDFFLRVFLDGGGCTQYDMTASVTLLIDDCDQATIVGAGVHDISNLTATTDGPDEPASCNFN